ncbi:MAG: hypothetical protein WC681_19550 [Sterolibacterium sp.]|jgi:hypothetical protein
MRKEIKGVGMTAVEIEHHETPDEIFAFFDEQSAQFRAAGSNNFERAISAVEEWAREELAGRGFKAGNALRVQSTPLFAGDSLPDRAANYAVKVLTYIKFARKAIKENNATEAGRCGVFIGQLFDRIQTTIEWEKFALRGKPMVESKRGPNALYRAAIQVLKREGAGLAAKRVSRELENSGVVRNDNGNLCWTDDKWRQKKTLFEQFEKRLSDHRKLIR